MTLIINELVDGKELRELEGEILNVVLEKCYSEDRKHKSITPREVSVEVVESFRVVTVMMGNLERQGYLVSPNDIVVSADSPIVPSFLLYSLDDNPERWLPLKQ